MNWKIKHPGFFKTIQSDKDSINSEGRYENIYY